MLQINAVIGTVHKWRAETSAEALQETARSAVGLARDTSLASLPTRKFQFPGGGSVVRSHE